MLQLHPLRPSGRGAKSCSNEKEHTCHEVGACSDRLLTRSAFPVTNPAITSGSHRDPPGVRIIRERSRRVGSRSQACRRLSRIVGARPSARRYGRPKDGRAMLRLRSFKCLPQRGRLLLSDFAVLRSCNQRRLGDARNSQRGSGRMALRTSWFSVCKARAMSRLYVASRGCPGTTESIRCIRLIHFSDVANPRSLVPCAPGFPRMLVRPSPAR